MRPVTCKVLLAILVATPGVEPVAGGCAPGDSTRRASPEVFPQEDVEEPGPPDVSGEVACKPDCKPRKKQCGDDGCGGSCGSCAAGEECKASFRCGLPCSPDDREPDENAEHAVAASLPASFTRALCPAGDADWYGFTVGVPTEVVVQSSGTDGGTYIRLLRSDGTEIEHDHEDDYGPFSRIVVEVLAGSYFVEVTPAEEGEEVREHKLTLSIDCNPDCSGRNCGTDGCSGTCGTCTGGQECAPDGVCREPCIDPGEPRETPAAAVPILPGQTLAAAMCAPGDQDWYSFDVTARAAAVRVRTRGLAEPTEVWLFDAAMVQIDHDDSDDTGDFSLIDETIGGGTHFVKVMAAHKGSIVPEYTVSLEMWCLPDCDDRACGDDGCGGSCGACPADHACDAIATCASTCIDQLEPDEEAEAAHELVPGTPAARSLCPIEDHDWFWFELAAPSDIRIETSGVEAPTEMWLFDDALVELEYDGKNEIIAFSVIEREAVPPGRYYVEVASKDWQVQVPHYTASLVVTPR
ncbi:MAG: PPC domain-containing protein [Deltaproteobacteria bacterium]|nr:PPC domain-containing protein [Deltaproteobacteria bacterium]